ncbi:MAG: radical SAM protein [Desulfobacterales bacterium]|nr:radical SAM protein [Desulfobacterales bacterium]
MTFCDPMEIDANEEREEAPPDLPEGVPPLTSFYLYLSTGCNLACRHCWITPNLVQGAPDPGDCLDPDLLREAVAEARPLGLRRAKLTGGEPTLHPRFLEIVDMLTREGLAMDMETNGTLMDADLARRLKEETNISFISVSLDGARADTHDAFRNREGAFAAALRGLDHLAAAGYENTQVIMCPHRGNINELEDLIRLAAERGAGSVKFNPVTRGGRGSAMHARGEALDHDETLALTHRVLGELQDRAPIRLVISPPPAMLTVKELLRTRDGGGSCRVRHIMGILGSGEMALCGIGRNVPELCYGKLGKESPREVWCTHPMLLKLRRDLDDAKRYPGVCGDCIHAARCLTHCVAHNYLDGGNLVQPSAACAEAERRGAFPMTRRREPASRKQA